MRPLRALPALLAVALSARLVLAEEVEVSEKARQRFRTGVAYLTDPDGARYEEAYREFKAAYADSASWKILGNLGISAMKLERDGEAVEAFRKYLDGGGDAIDPAERAQMERDLMTTQGGLVWLEVEVTPPEAELVDERLPLTGRSVINTYALDGGKLRVGIRRGRHKVVARLRGYDDAVWEVSAEPGVDLKNTFQLQKPKPAPAAAPVPAVAAGPSAPPATERPVTVPIIVGAAVTGAALVGGAVVGVMATGKKSDFDAANGKDPAQAQDLKDSGEMLNLVADGCFGLAVVGAGVTAYLFFTRPEVAVGADAGPSASIRWAPAIGRGVGGIVATGRF